MLGNFAFYFSSVVFCVLIFLSKTFFRNSFNASNSLDPDQVRRFLGPDVVLNSFQNLSTDDKLNCCCNFAYSSALYGVNNVLVLAVTFVVC